MLQLFHAITIRERKQRVFVTAPSATSPQPTPRPASSEKRAITDMLDGPMPKAGDKIRIGSG